MAMESAGVESRYALHQFGPVQCYSVVFVSRQIACNFFLGPCVGKRFIRAVGMQSVFYLVPVQCYPVVFCVRTIASADRLGIASIGQSAVWYELCIVCLATWLVLRYSCCDGVC